MPARYEITIEGADAVTVSESALFDAWCESVPGEVIKALDLAIGETVRVNQYPEIVVRRIC